MTKKEGELTVGGIVGSVFVFLFNYVVQFGISLLMVYLHHRSAFSAYITAHLPVLLFMAGCLFLLLMMAYFYFLFGNKAFLSETKNIWLLFAIIDVCVVLFCMYTTFWTVYARPVALFALLCLYLIGYKDAIFLNSLFSILIFLFDVFIDYGTYETTGFTGDMFFALMVCLIGGTFAIFIGRSARTRTAIVGAGLLSAVPISVVMLLLEVSNYVNLGNRMWWLHVLYGMAGCVVAVAVLFLLMPVFEWMFGVLTVFRLRELTSPEAKLLKRLKEQANGTFNHSTAVAQLVEACASALGENVELARACAYYHDVGKIRRPDYFTENQTDHNVHDELSPELSVDIIRSHSKDGYDLILANRLPRIFADVARQHHGTMPIRYFYCKALRMSDGEVNIEDYSYRGPKPTTKIAALVMIADACEAAARSLADHSPAKVEEKVREIIEERLDQDQFSDCDITIRELNVVKDTLVGGLTGMYHRRIKYPDLQVRRRKQETEAAKGE